MQLDAMSRFAIVCQVTPAKQIDAFLAKYTPEIAAQACACLKIMRKRLPHAYEMVYDNYNALVFRL